MKSISSNSFNNNDSFIGTGLYSQAAAEFMEVFAIEFCENLYQSKVMTWPVRFVKQLSERLTKGVDNELLIANFKFFACIGEKTVSYNNKNKLFKYLAAFIKDFVILEQKVPAQLFIADNTNKLFGQFEVRDAYFLYVWFKNQSRKLKRIDKSVYKKMVGEKLDILTTELISAYIDEIKTLQENLSLFISKINSEENTEFDKIHKKYESIIKEESDKVRDKINDLNIQIKNLKTNSAVTA